MKVTDRFFEYISYWTTSDESSDSAPSAERERPLAELIAGQLKEMGACDVVLTDTCYIYATIPATPGHESDPVCGFISHIDTAPDFNGRDIHPQVIRDYGGGDVPLRGNGTLLQVSDFPDLCRLKGRTLITTDGTSLLGADDKAGISEIMAAADQLLHSDIPHGKIRIGFTPDEEIGRGTDGFDVDAFGADFAFTVDGDYEGEVAWENFNAASAGFEIKGVGVHPGEAKGIMKNAALIATEIAGMLPADETPQATEGREGFYHLTSVGGDVTKAHLEYIIRDHDDAKFEAKKKQMTEIADAINDKYGSGTVHLTMRDQYHNMRRVMAEHMDVIRLAEDAIRSVGMELISRPIRGGTDGAMLSFCGLPCPNLGTGGYGFHGPFEHITAEAMETMVRILIYIASHV